jgi:hypothetical protein
MSYGIIEYNSDGEPKCEICNKHFKRVIVHARQKHNISEKEYKMQFGFDLKKGICSKDSSEKSRIKTLENYDKLIAINLTLKGVKSIFLKGNKGRTKEQVSEQTRLMLIERLKKPEMIVKMKESGKKVGSSGLGNKKRWANKNPKVQGELH